MEYFNLGGLRCLRLKAGASSFEFCPERGARLLSWRLELPSGVREVIYWPKSFDASKFGSVRGGNPVLFPFAGRCHVDGAPGFWVDTRGVKRPYPQHGLVRQGACELAEYGEDFVTMRFLPCAADAETYPYDYEFLVRYRVRELGLTVEYELRNRGEDRIPWGPGHHFYFTLPWNPGLSRKDHLLRLDAKKIMRHASDGGFTPAGDVTLPAAFDNPALSDTMFTQIRGDSLRFGPRNGEEDIRITFDAGSSATVVAWTQEEASPFYCVEPWTCPPNSPARKFLGARWAEPGCADIFRCSVELA